jgi:hypothetical protein
VGDGAGDLWDNRKSVNKPKSRRAAPMRVSQEPTAPVTPEKAFDRLRAFIAERRSSKEPRSDMECFERELHEYVVAAEREVLAEELARLGCGPAGGDDRG